MAELTDQVRQLVTRARELCQDAAAQHRLAAVEQRLDEPLRVAIAGKVKAGKSTLLNALVGEQLAPTDAGECTKIVTWYQHGHTYRVTLDLIDGTSRPARFTRPSGAIDIDWNDAGLGGAGIDQVKRIVVEWPTRRLADVTLIDTPGVASIDTAVSDRALAFLTPDDGHPVEADAVLYLMRHMHADDLSFLESFHDDELAHPSPVNAIGLLSRADEVAVGRPDAMRVAGRVAARYRTDERLRKLCQTVLPVAGLLAETAATLTQDEFEALERLAGHHRRHIEALMLSADRFVADTAAVGGTAAASTNQGVADEPTCSVPPLVRRHLLDRFGLFGVRVALPLIRQGRATTAGDLARALDSRSGMVALREDLAERFANRRDVLQARSALLAVDRLLPDLPDGAAFELGSEIERIRAGAHAFAEIRLLNDCRRGLVTFAGIEDDEVERLLGAAGPSPTARLGLRSDAAVGDVRAALLAEVEKWRRRGAHPLAPKETTDAASVLVRTCEGALADLG